MTKHGLFHHALPFPAWSLDDSQEMVGRDVEVWPTTNIMWRRVHDVISTPWCHLKFAPHWCFYNYSIKCIMSFQRKVDARQSPNVHSSPQCTMSRVSLVISTMQQDVRNYHCDVNTGNVHLDRTPAPRASSPNGLVRWPLVVWFRAQNIVPLNNWWQRADLTRAKKTINTGSFTKSNTIG